MPDSRRWRRSRPATGPLELKSTGTAPAQQNRRARQRAWRSTALGGWTTRAAETVAISPMPNGNDKPEAWSGHGGSPQANEEDEVDEHEVDEDEVDEDEVDEDEVDDVEVGEDSVADACGIRSYV